jgi:hypothetical protein
MVPSVSQTVVLFRVRHAGYSHVMWQHAAACCCLFFFTTRSRDCSRACAWPTTKLLSLPLSLAGSLLPQVLPHSLSHFSRLTWRKDGRTTTIESAPTDRPNGFVQSTNGRAPEEGRKERACAGCWELKSKEVGRLGLGFASLARSLPRSLPPLPAGSVSKTAVRAASASHALPSSTFLSLFPMSLCFDRSTGAAAAPVGSRGANLLSPCTHPHAKQFKVVFAGVKTH